MVAMVYICIAVGILAFLSGFSFGRSIEPKKKQNKTEEVPHYPTKGYCTVAKEVIDISYNENCNDMLSKKIYATLLNGPKFAFEVAEELNISTRKASALLRSMEECSFIFYYELKVPRGRNKGLVLKKYYINLEETT
jgi:hypothetical protein